MVLQVEPFNIIGENALIGKIKADNHTVSVVVHAEYIFIQGYVGVAHKACYAIAIVQSTDKRSVSGSGVCCDQTFSGQNIKNICNQKWLPTHLVNGRSMHIFTKFFDIRYGVCLVPL